MSLVLDSHRKYLSDLPRLSAFQRATQEVIKAGDVVLDLGSGTGIMALLACQAGASRVYAIEADGIIGIARQIAADNGYADRIQFIRGLSTRVELPEKVDVAVTDQIGRIGFEAGIFQYYADAIRRFLKPGGKLIPGELQLWAAPVTSLQRWQDCQFWNGSPVGLNFRAASSIANNTGYPLTFTPEELLARPQCAAQADMYHADPDSWLGTATFEIERQATLHGVGGWFRAQLSAGVSLTNSPLAADRINRRNVFLPFGQALEVNPGDRVSVKLRAVPSEIALSWSAKVETGVRAGQPKSHRFVHSTMLGMLLSQEDLARTQLDSVPRLTAWGLARRTVLELVDGSRKLADVETGLLERHPDLFSDRKDAAVFVAEVVTRYTY